MRQIRRPRIYNAPRLSLVVGLFGLSFVAIVIRLAIVQVIKHPYLQEQAGRQYRRTITLHPERGRILDRHGRVLATSMPMPSVCAFPREIANPAETARQLARTLDVPLAKVWRSLHAKSPFVWVARQVEPEKVAALQALRLPGVQVHMEARRFYPKRHLAGQVLGFVGIDGQGLGGLEHLYNTELSGSPRHVVGQRDARGRQFRLRAQADEERPRGADLYLTLDERLQYIAEKEIAAQVRAVGARSGVVVMMQPLTGELLALAAYPFFNPNDFQDPSQRAWRRNRILTDPVEPGSTFKIVAAAAALEEGTIRHNEKFYCEKGKIQRGKRLLRDHHPYEFLTFAETVAKSSNICMVKLNERISSAQFYDYIRRFGFGKKTGVDLPGENAGKIRPPHQWSDLSHDSLTIGQELTVTPLQLTNAFAAVANGGWLRQPYMVSRIVDGETTRILEPRVHQRVILQQSAEALTAMLVGVVEHGTGKQAALDSHVVAGKTGTAQKVAPTGGYSRRRLLASFVGYVPAEAPELVMLVMLDEPNTERWGGTAAAPVFQRIAQQALHYLQVPARQAQPLTLGTAPALAFGTSGD